MLILAVDTSTKDSSLAVLQDETLLGEVANDSKEPYSVGMFRDLDALLGGLRLTLSDINLFAVVAGPGSFTGLRLGLTSVKAWSEIYGTPIAAVSGLQAVAAQASASAEKIIAPVIDARRGQIFGALFDRGESELKPLSPEVVLSAEEFLAMVEREANGGAPLFVSPAPELIEPALRNANSALASARVEKVRLVLAASAGRLGYRAASRGNVVDALHLEAQYLRRPDAEVNWKGF